MNAHNSGEALVTGSVIVGERQVEHLKQASLAVTWIKAPPSGTALCELVRGKSVYICGGRELVDDQVVRAASALKVIGFPGSGYTEFIPGWEEATRRGIPIVTAVGMNAPAVAEYAITLMLAMLRRVPEQARLGSLVTEPTREISGLTLAIIGLGRSGVATAKLGKALGMRVLGVSRSMTENPEVQVATLQEALQNADIVSLHVDRINGRAVLGRDELKHLRPGALVVNVAFPDAIVWSALRQEIETGRLRAAYDAPPEGEYADLSPERFFASARQTAFNTREANTRAGDHIVAAVLEVLRAGTSPAVVNPDFQKFRARGPIP